MFNIPKDRFIIIATILILMWLGLMIFFYLKADEVTKHPCSVCAKQMGEKVVCYPQTIGGNNLVFYPNFTIEHVRG